MAQVFVVIPVHNRVEQTLQCLKSVLIHKHIKLKVIVVDDGSTDGTEEQIRSRFPDVTILVGDGNLWWTGATNLGVRKALEEASPDDYILTLNNDTVLPENYLEILFHQIERHPHALIGSVALDNDRREIIVEAGVNINWFTAKYTYYFKNKKYRELRGRGRASYQPTVLPGRGTAIPISAFHEIGLFDQDVFPHYAADYDFSLRAAKAGYKLVVCFDLVLYSFPNLSGIANTDARVSFRQVLKSFRSIRSANNLLTRFQFARRNAPRILFPLFVMADTLRVVFGTLINRTKFSLR